MFTVDDSELRTLAVDLERESPRVGREVSAAIRASADRVQAHARAGAPVASGNLRRSIGYDLYGSGNSVGVTAVVGPTERYGPFVEHGTTKMDPQPFMEPALTGEAPALEQAIADIAGRVLDG